MKFRIFVRFLLVMVFLLLVLTGCGNNSKSSTGLKDVEDNNTIHDKQQPIAVTEPAELKRVFAAGQLESKDLFMGQKIEAQGDFNLNFSHPSEVSMVAGNSLLAAYNRTTKEAVFFRQENLQELARTNIQLDISGYGDKKFFWGDLLVIVSRNTGHIYAVSEEGASLIWKGNGNFIAPGAGALLNAGDYLISYGKGIQLFRQKEREVTMAWQSNEPWQVTDLHPYGDNRLLIATEDRGWLLLELEGFTVKELGVGGPYEAAAWKEFGRKGRMFDYKFHGVSKKGVVLASVEGAGTNGSHYGTYYQLWAPYEEGMRLIGENLLVWTEVSIWAAEEEETIGGSFSFHPGTSQWFSWKGFEEAGGRYAVLELNEAAVEKALEKGMYGGKIRFTGENEADYWNQNGQARAPLSNFFVTVKDMGFRSLLFSQLTQADIYGDGRLEVLIQLPDGAYLIPSQAEGIQDVRLTTGDLYLGTIDEKHRRAYFFREGQLFSVDFAELVKVDRQTVYPSPEVKWAFSAQDEIIDFTLAGGKLYLLTQTGLQALDIAKGEKEPYRLKWDLEIERTGENVATNGEFVYFLSSSDDWSRSTLHAIDGSTSGQVWTFDIKAPAHRIYLDQAGGKLYIPVSKTLLAVDAITGEKLWSFEHGDRYGNATAGIIDELLFVGTDRYLYALDRETGAQKIRFTTDLSETLITGAAKGLLLAGGWSEGDSSFLYALDLESGQKKWEVEIGYKVPLFAPGIAGNTVYVILDGSYGAGSGILHALELETGQKRWALEDLYFTSPVVYAAETIYATNASGYLYALDTYGGIKWEFNPGAASKMPKYWPALLPVVVDNEVVYFAVGESLYALKGFIN